MIHVRFHNCPGGERDLWLPAVPRQGDEVAFEDVSRPVHSVAWEIEPHPESPSAVVLVHVYLGLP